MAPRPSKKISSLSENAIATINRAKQFQQRQKQNEAILAAMPKAHWKYPQIEKSTGNWKKRKLAAVRTARKAITGKKQEAERTKMSFEQFVASMQQIPKGQLVDKYRLALKTKYDLTKKMHSGKQINFDALRYAIQAISAIEEILPKPLQEIIKKEFAIY